MQMDHLILVRRPELVIINTKKENLQNCELCCPADHSVKLKESEKKDKYLELKVIEKTVEPESDGDTNCNWCSWYSH